MDLLIRRGASLLLQMGAPITWYFKEKAARDATEILFRQNGITGIKLVYSRAIKEWKMKHCMLLWKKPSAKPLQTQIDCAFDVFSVIRDLREEYSPHFYKANKKKTSQPIAWSADAFMEALKKNPVNKGNQLLSKTMDDAAALFKQGDYQQSIDMFARAWDLLPDSKYSYDESYLIVWRILIVALKANDTAVMKRWVKHIFLADPERADCGEREMWGARVAMACGDKEKAFQYIDVAMEKSHGRCFERSDTAIKEAYLNAR